MPSTMVTVLPVPGLGGELDEESVELSTNHVRAKDTERGGARRKPQYRCNGLELCPVVCDIRVVNHSPHPEDARANSPKVCPGWEQDPVLLKHSIHRLMLSTERVSVQPEPNGKHLLCARHSERSTEAQANFEPPNNVDVSFEPSRFPVWLDEDGVT